VGRDQIKRSHNADESERHELRHNENITHLRARPHAAIVHNRKDSHKRRENQESRKGQRGRTPKCPQVDDKQIGAGRAGSQTTEQIEPADLNASETSESCANVKVRPSRLRKLRRHLGIACNDDCNRNSGNRHSNQACSADQSCNHRRKSEHCAA